MSVLDLKVSEKLTHIVGFMKVLSVVEVIDDIMPMARRHLLRTARERVEHRPDSLQGLSICHANTRKEVVGVRSSTGARVCWGVKLANGGKGVGEEHDTERRQCRKFVMVSGA